MHDDSLTETAQPSGARAIPPGPQARLAHWPLLALLAWCLAFLAIRLAEHGTLERDEAEIVYLTQHLRLGYGTQPPLYAWLQWLAFQALGIDRFSLLLLKTLALAGTCVAMFQASRALLGRRGAVAATASLALFLQIGWEALRIQTHSVLLTAIAAATLWLYFALLRRPTLARYAWFGVLCGLGLQTKYNYGIFLACVFGASLLVRAHREVLWTRKAWAAVLPAVLLVLPHAAWVATHADLAFAGTVRKMQEDGAAGASYATRAALGAVGVLKALASFVAVPALVCAAVCWRRRALWRGQAAFDAVSPSSRFFACLYGLCGLLLAALALTGEVGTIKERWMIPLLFSLPLGLFIMFPALGRDAIYRDLSRIGVVFALCLLAMLPLRTWLGPALGKDMTRHHPYAALAQAVQRQCPAARTIITESLLSAGNLRFARPVMATVLLEDAQRERPALNGPAALVTHAHAAPAALAAFHAVWPRASLAPRTEVSLAVEDGSGRRMDFMVACAF
jgi:4-amino-4-deoxy-L-arabinose transferase-like glycosyltransferase